MSCTWRWTSSAPLCHCKSSTQAEQLSLAHAGLKIGILQPGKLIDGRLSS